MHNRAWKPVRSFLSALLTPLMALLIVVPADLLAQDHVVSRGDLQAQLNASAHERSANVAKLERFLSTDAAQKVMETAKVEPAKIRNAVHLLNDQELARLAAQADQANFAAGGLSLTNQQITYIIIGAIVIILVAVLVSH